MSNKDTNGTEPVQQPIEEESNGRGKSFLTVLLMAILIGTGVYAFLRGAPEETDDSVQEQIEQIREEDQANGEGEESENGDTTESAESSESDTTTTPSTPAATEPEVTAVTEEKISVRASAGDGVTHLARRAIQERLQTQEIELSAAQKIYAETVLTQNESYYQQSIDPSAEIDFSNQDIDDVIRGAQDLSQSQIDAWNVYVPHVPSLQ